MARQKRKTNKSSLVGPLPKLFSNLHATDDCSPPEPEQRRSFENTKKKKNMAAEKINKTSATTLVRLRSA